MTETEVAPKAYVETCTTYLAVIFINGGTSFASADNVLEAVAGCKRVCKQDWGSMFKLDGVAYIHFYDHTQATGWYANHTGEVRDRDTPAPARPRRGDRRRAGPAALPRGRAAPRRPDGAVPAASLRAS